MNYEVKDFKYGIEQGMKAFYYRKKVDNENYMEYAVQMADLSESKDKEEEFINIKIPQPKIGAVLSTDEWVYCSARSGIKHGDHAEFTILETLLSDKKIDDKATLYTTLEPCTPESRSRWTESCSSLIINRNIKNVCIGTLDANPLVFGVGVAKLLENGVNVTFFDYKYVEKLKNLNKEFFDFCEQYPDIKVLKKVDKYLKEHIDEEALRIYYKNEPVNVDLYVKFYREMLDSEQIKESKIDGMFSISKDLALTFMKKPSYFLPGYNFAIVDERGKKDTDEKNYNPRVVIDRSLLVLLNEKYENNIYNEIANRINKSKIYDFEEAKKIIRKEYKIDFLILREKIANAIVHNNYNHNLGVTIKLLSEKKMDIINLLPDFLNYEKELEVKFNNGELITIPQNPVLMKYFLNAQYVENMGYGTTNEFVKYEITNQLNKHILITKISSKKFK